MKPGVRLIGKADNTPPEGGGVIMVAVNVPPQYMEGVASQRLVPSELVLEQVAAGGLFAGRAVKLPVRELSPMDVVVMMQRAIAGGRVVASIGFTVPEPEAPKEKEA